MLRYQGYHTVPGRFGRVVSANFGGGSFRPWYVGRFGPESFGLNSILFDNLTVI